MTAAVPVAAKSNCTGQPVDRMLEIRVDGNGAPTEIIDAATGNNADILIVCPGAGISWQLPGERQFKIEFRRRETPFPWPRRYKLSSQQPGKHELADRIRSNARYDGYKYTVYVANSSLDPMIIVDR